jgi:cell division protein FtsL
VGRILCRRKKFYNTDPVEQMVKKQQINFLKEKVFILGFSAVNILNVAVGVLVRQATTLNYFHFGHQK